MFVIGDSCVVSNTPNRLYEMSFDCAGSRTAWNTPSTETSTSESVKSSFAVANTVVKRKNIIIATKVKKIIAFFPVLAFCCRFGLSCVLSLVARFCLVFAGRRFFALALPGAPRKLDRSIARNLLPPSPLFRHLFFFVHFLFFHSYYLYISV